MSRIPARRAVPLVAALLAGVVAPPSHAAACVTRSGPWSIARAPATMHAADATVAFGRDGRDVLYAYDSFTSDMPRGRALLRSTDGGCTWSTAVSLDTVGTANDVWRLDTGYQLVTLAVAQATRARPARIYAVASDDTYTLGVSMPIVTVVSLDGGATWAVRQPAPAALAGDYPRCGKDGFQTTTLKVGTDPSTLYLRCHVGGLGDVALQGAECNDAYYVTHDAAVTWTAARGRLRDPAKASDNVGCGRGWWYPTPSTVTPRTVWDVGFDSAAATTTLSVSHDDGATFAPVATTKEKTNGPYGFAVSERPGRAPVLAVVGTNDLWLSGPAGPLSIVPRPVPPHGRIGAIAGAAFLPDGRLFVAYDLDKPAGSAAYVLDVARRRWQRVPLPPKRSDLQPAWHEYGPVPVVSGPERASVWIETFDDHFVRYAP